MTTASKEPTSSWPADTEPMIEARAAGATHASIAQTLGVSTKTVARRLALPGVAAEITRRQMDSFGAVRAQLVTDSHKAAAVLVELLDSDDENIRMRAAEKVIGSASRLHHQVLADHELVDRLDELEAHHQNLAGIANQEARHLALGKDGS